MEEGRSEQKKISIRLKGAKAGARGQSSRNARGMKTKKTRTGFNFNLEGKHYCALTGKRTADGQSEFAERIGSEECMPKGKFAYEDMITVSRDKTSRTRTGKEIGSRRGSLTSSGMRKQCALLLISLWRNQKREDGKL